MEEFQLLMTGRISTLHDFEGFLISVEEVAAEFLSYICTNFTSSMCNDFYFYFYAKSYLAYYTFSKMKNIILLNGRNQLKKDCWKLLRVASKEQRFPKTDVRVSQRQCIMSVCALLLKRDHGNSSRNRIGGESLWIILWKYKILKNSLSTPSIVGMHETDT